MSPYEQIQEKILTLQSQILASHPQMPLLLQQIHRTIKNDPALVTLLQEDEIATIVQGLSKQTQSVIATAAVKPSAATKKALSKVTTDDLGF